MTQQDLDALGGEAYFYALDQLWLIDADQAYHLSPNYVLGFDHAALTHLEAARALSRNVGLADIEAMLRSLPATRPATAVPPPTATPPPTKSLAALAADTAFIKQAWIIDGENALGVPVKHITYQDDSAASHLEAARRGGIRLSLSRPESVITDAVMSALEQAQRRKRCRPDLWMTGLAGGGSVAI